MTPHTNQVVPVERDQFEAWYLKHLMESSDLSEDEARIYLKYGHFSYRHTHTQTSFVAWQAAIAATPQQQGEPVGEICEELRREDGAVLHYAKLFQHLPLGTKLFTHPLTADASFNQALELAGNKAQHIMPAEHLSSAEKHVFDDAVIQYRREIMKLKRPTDMVTMTRDKFETHIAAAIGIGLAEAQNRVAGNVGNALDEAKAYVSRTLKEGK